MIFKLIKSTIFKKAIPFIKTLANYLRCQDKLNQAI